jgi:replicative DNA helicase
MKKYETPNMEKEAQHLYLNAMLSNPDIFVRVNQLIDPSFFDPEVAKGIKFLQDYYDEHRVVPATSIFSSLTKLPVEQVVLAQEDRAFIMQQIAEFCRFRAVINVIQKAVGQGGYLEKGALGEMVAKMKEASDISLMSDLGISYFENVEQRLESYDQEEAVISTGWKSVDQLIGGGIGRQELILFLAPSGGGKSVGMLNLGHNLMKQGMSGVYISLEMKDTKVTKRLDQMLARMMSGMISLNKTQVAHEIHRFHEETGVNFHVKRMRESTTTARDITAYLKELRAKFNFRPDWIVVDYLDIMDSVRRGYGDSLFLKEKYVAEEVRAIGFDENAIMISGAQLGKHATEAIEEGKAIHQGDVQGGSSKTNTSDLQISMEKTEAMHQAGIYRFGFPKSRNSDAVGKRIEMKWDKISLRITDMNNERTELKLNKKDSTAIDIPIRLPGQRRDIQDILNSATKKLAGDQ